MEKVAKKPLSYEETVDKKSKNIFSKKDKKISEVVTKKLTAKVDKNKNTLSIYTYMNWKRFGISVAIDDGIKINILCFEISIKFERK